MAKFLMVSKEGLGAWFTLRLLEENHSVDYCIHSDEDFNVLKGIAPKPLTKKPDYSKYDAVIFDVTGLPELADESAEQSPTMGDSSFASQLEDDRLFGIEVMEQMGIDVPFYEHFDNLSKAKQFIKKTEKRYVFKPFTSGKDEQNSCTTYVSKSSEDLIRYLDTLEQKSKGMEFILQEVVAGTEGSINAYFDGTDFHFITMTLECKKFMNDEKGPNTGCSGNAIIMLPQDTQIYRMGLLKVRDFLQQAGFCGPIDLNTIITDSKIYGLEWTPRFGYDSTATENQFIISDIGDFLGAIASKTRPVYETRGKFAVGVRVSIPPYPSEFEEEQEPTPIEGLTPDECIKDCYLYSVMLDRHNTLCTAGNDGNICVPLAKGDTLEQAFGRCYAKVNKIHIPDMQYRTDLDKVLIKRFKILEAQGWLT